MYVEIFHNVIRRNIEFVVSKGLLDDEELWNYDKSDVHSVLQYCLIRIEDLDIVPLPEYKTRFRDPIDKVNIDKRFEGKKSRRVWFTKVDVTYLKNSNVIGVGEVFTPDEIHGVLPSTELSGPRVSPRHRIEHLVEHLKISFIIIVNVVNRLPPWKEARRHSVEVWESKWKDFVKDICTRHKIQCLHIVMRSVKDVEYNLYAKPK
jgi:hypothetical protein